MEDEFHPKRKQNKKDEDLRFRNKDSANRRGERDERDEEVVGKRAKGIVMHARRTDTGLGFNYRKSPRRRI